MGASMLLESIGFRADKQFDLDKEQAGLALAQARAAIEELDQARFDVINDELCGEYEDLVQYRELLRKDIAEVESALSNDRHDADFIAGGIGVVLLISGGLSWGDPPTQLYESMSRLRHAEVMPDVRWPGKP